MDQPAVARIFAPTIRVFLPPVPSGAAKVVLNTVIYEYSLVPT